MSNQFYGAQQGMGMGYGQQPWQQQPMAGQMAPQNVNMPMNTTLTADEINTLRNRHTKDLEAFFQVPKDAIETTRLKCNHHTQDGQSTLTTNSDGSCTCSICGTTFQYIEPDVANRKELSENVRHAVNQIHNIWETIKTNWGPISPEIAERLYTFGTVIEQLPKMWDKSAEYILNYYGNINPAQPNYGFQNDYSTFNRLNAITMGQPMGFAQAAAPQWGMGFQQPMAQQWNGGMGVAPQQGFQQPVQGMQQPNQGWGAPQAYQAPVAQPAQQPMADPMGQAMAQAAPAPVAADPANPAAAMSNPIGQQVQSVSAQIPSFETK